MRPFGVVLFSIILVSAFFAPTALSQQACKGYSFSNNAVYRSCIDLLLSSSLHWNYDQSTNVANVAFRRSGTTSSQWISWGINPKGRRMVGTQSLMAYQNSSGSVFAFTTPIESYNPSLTPSSLSFGVPNINATFEGGVMTIFATLKLDSGMVSVNHVWQEGPMDSNGSPGLHSTSGANGRSMGKLDFFSGVTTTAGSNNRQTRKNVHGVLNAVSWGTLMPLGAVIARYLKVFKSTGPAWFYLHITCQTSAYVVGVAGWITGLKLGSDSSADTGVHGNIGASLFVMATLQVGALLLWPKPDHKYRFFWNIYHHSIGYAVIALSVFNVFKGLDILDADGKWTTSYTIIISIIAGCAALLEVLTWIIVLKRRKEESRDQNKFSHSINGHTNGFHDRV